MSSPISLRPKTSISIVIEIILNFYNFLLNLYSVSPDFSRLLDISIYLLYEHLALSTTRTDRVCSLQTCLFSFAVGSLSHTGTQAGTRVATTRTQASISLRLACRQTFPAPLSIAHYSSQSSALLMPFSSSETSNAPHCLNENQAHLVFKCGSSYGLPSLLSHTLI